jgi:hypothetical protein
MKHFIFALLGQCLLASHLAAQNLVPNPGFETFTACPASSCEWYLASDWSSVNNFIGCNNGNSGSPDYFNACGSSFFGFPLTLNAQLNPLSGNAVMGLCTWLSFRPNFREYLSVPLTVPLVAGDSYTLRFYYTNGQPNPAVNYGGQGTQLGAHFSVGPLTQTGANPIILTPTYESPGPLFSQTWQLVVFSFTANANFTHLTFGNFRNDANTAVQQFATPSSPTFTYAYYYFDDVSVEEEVVLSAAEVLLEIHETDQGLKLLAFPDRAMERMQVERSADGWAFEPVELRNLEAGFAWLDALPLAGENIYRVRYLTADGTEGLSEAVRARWDEELRWVIGPNPVGPERQVLIQHNAPQQREAGIRLLDVEGREVGGWQLNIRREHWLDLSALAPGLYMLELSAGGVRSTKRLMLMD